MDYVHEMYCAAADFTVADRAAQVGVRRGIRATQAALVQLLSKPGVTAPITGATKPPHLDDAAAVDVRLDPEDIRFLEEPYQPHRILGHS